MPRVKLFNIEEVLQKAMELFWKKGYSATSIQDLVDGLGINRASLYDTFGGKKELFDKSFKLYRETRIKATSDFLNSQASTKTGIYKLFEYAVDDLVDDTDSKGCFVVNTTTELIPESGDTNITLSKNKAMYEKIFSNYLKKGVQKGDFSADKNIAAIASYLYTLYCGIMVVAKIDASKNKLLAIVKSGLTVLH